MAGQSRLSNAAGAFTSTSKLSNKIYAVAQPLVRYRQFCDVKGDLGKREGDTLLFDITTNLSAAIDGAVIAEGTRIPKSDFSYRQVSVTATPSGLSTDWTEEFETMAQSEVRSTIQSRLIDNMAKNLDYRAYLQFAATKVMYIPTGAVGAETATWDVDGTVSTAATRNIQVYDWKNVVDAMKWGRYGAAATGTSAPVPLHDGNNYVGICAVPAARALRDDPYWENFNLYGDPEKGFSGEAGRLYGARIVEDNHILGYLGTTSYSGSFFLFGAETVKEVVVVPEEIRIDLPDDFGRELSAAWYYLGAFKIIYSFDATTMKDNRIVFGTST